MALHWCVDIQYGFPFEAMSILCTVPNLSENEKMSAAKRLHRQFRHPSFVFMKEVLSNLMKLDKESFEIMEKYTNECMICKSYKPTTPRPNLNKYSESAQPISQEHNIITVFIGCSIYKKSA